MTDLRHVSTMGVWCAHYHSCRFNAALERFCLKSQLDNVPAHEVDMSRCWSFPRPRCAPPTPTLNAQEVDLILCQDAVTLHTSWRKGLRHQEGHTRAQQTSRETCLRQVKGITVL